MAPRPKQRTRKDATQRFFNHSPGIVSFNGARSCGLLRTVRGKNRIFIKAELRHGKPIVVVPLQHGIKRRWFEIEIDKCTSADIVCTSDFIHDHDGKLSADLGRWNKSIVGFEIPKVAPTSDENRIRFADKGSRYFGEGSYGSQYLGMGGWRYLSLLLDEVPEEVQWKGDDLTKFTRRQRAIMDQLSTCNGTIDILVILDKDVGARVMPAYIAGCDAVLKKNRMVEKSQV